MNLVKRCIAAGLGAAALTLSLAASAAPIDVAGIKVADPIELQGSTLQLNGAGIRYKAIFKVYVAALYLSKKAATPEEVMSQPGPKRISITLLREIESNELGKSFTKAFEENTPKNQMVALIPGLVRMGEIFAAQKKLAPGENFTIDWIPGTGAVISVKGVPQGAPFKEVEFFNALVRIWLGPEPADFKLKEVMLGKAS